VDDIALRLRVLTAAFEGAPVNDLPLPIAVATNHGTSRIEPAVPIARLLPILRETVERGEVRIVDVAGPAGAVAADEIGTWMRSVDDLPWRPSMVLELTDLGEERLDELVAGPRDL
jgi:hypothetical protein